MTPKDWMARVANRLTEQDGEVIPDRLLPPLVTHLTRRYSASLLTEQTADAVARMLSGFPSRDDLDACMENLPASMRAPEPASGEGKAIGIWKRLFDNRVASGTCTLQYLGMVRAHGAPEVWAHVLREHRDVVQGLAPQWLDDEEANDRAWWRERMAQILAHPHPSSRWVRLMETRAQVTQADSIPRPWLVAALDKRIAKAEAEGADTTLEVRPPRRLPQRPQDLMGMAAE
jgi:hypothetical protein